MYIKKENPSVFSDMKWAKFNIDATQENSW